MGVLPPSTKAPKCKTWAQYASIVSMHKLILCIVVLEFLEMNECANSLQVAKVNECWKEQIKKNKNNILQL